LSEILEKVRSGIKGRNEVIRMLFENSSLKSKVAHYILSNGGSKNDVDSLLTDAIIAFVKRCYNVEFSLSSNSEAYIIKIVKNNWIRQKMKENKDRKLDAGDDRYSIESEFLKQDDINILRRVIKELDERCRKVMLLWSQNLRMREIAIRMEYKSEGMARKKKFECIQKMKTLFKKHDI
jgi:RNA polymerase sigma factor (sigma-70 family)